jgi:hypothetical protein
MAKKKRQPLDFKGKVAIGTLVFVGVYLVWCWFMRLLFGITLDESIGGALPALATFVTEILGLSLIQVSKHLSRKEPIKQTAKTIKKKGDDT